MPEMRAKSHISRRRKENSRDFLLLFSDVPVETDIAIFKFSLWIIAETSAAASVASVASTIHRFRLGGFIPYQMQQRLHKNGISFDLIGTESG